MSLFAEVSAQKTQQNSLLAKPLTQVDASHTADVIVQLKLPQISGRRQKNYFQEIADTQSRLERELGIYQKPGKSQQETMHHTRHVPLTTIRNISPSRLQILLASNDVIAVYPDIELQPATAQSLPLIQQDIVTPLLDGTDYSIAIFDTGVDYTKTALGSCTAPDEPETCRVVVAVDIAPDDGVLDTTGHGSNVASVAATAAPGASIIALDIFQSSSASLSNIIAGIDWVIDNHEVYQIAAINLSLGDGGQYNGTCLYPPFDDAITQVRALGIVPVVATGNNGYRAGVSFPACSPGTVSVAAVYDSSIGSFTGFNCSDTTTRADQITCYANTGLPLDLLAPGSSISVDQVSLNGSSYSAPFVSAAVTLVREVFGSLTANDIVTKLLTSSTLVNEPISGLSFPRLDILAMLSTEQDNLNNALNLTGTSGTQILYNFGATQENNEPFHAGLPGGSSIWLSYTPTRSGYYSFDTTGSQIDTLLALYSGSTFANLIEQSSNDNATTQLTSSRIRVELTVGETYLIAIDGVDAAQGGITFNWLQEPTTTQIPLIPWWGILTLFVGLVLLGCRTKGYGAPPSRSDKFRRYLQCVYRR